MNTRFIVSSSAGEVSAQKVALMTLHDQGRTVYRPFPDCGGTIHALPFRTMWKSQQCQDRNVVAGRKWKA